MGLLFGWMVNGWAAYANVFFALVMRRLYSGKAAPEATVLMVLSLSTILFFSGVLVNEGGAIQPVASWGWGALLWAASILLAATASALRSGWIGSRGALSLSIAVGLLFPAAALAHLLQRSKANLQERELYLSAGMAFTTVEFCGVPFIWPQGALIPPGERITLEIHESLKPENGRQPLLHLPRFTNVQEGRYVWTTFEDPEISTSELKVRSAAQPTRYALHVSPATGGATILLIDTHTSTTLYEQPLRAKRVRRDWVRYCPLETTFTFGTELGYEEALLRAVGQQRPVRSGDGAPIADQGRRPARLSTDPLKAEDARTPCSLSGKDVDGVPGLMEWDGRHVILKPESERSRLGFCSDSYIGLVYVATGGESDPDHLSPRASLYDRTTLRPIARFADGSCRSRYCPEAPRDIVRGFRVESDALIIRTERGDLRANRVR